MAAYNFKKRFAPLVESGEKRQTIRAERKDGRKPRIGETLYLYTGMRTKGCRRLLKSQCQSVEEIKIFNNIIIVSGTWLEPYEVAALTRDDGFENENEFFEFFKEEHGLPFRGLLIKWEPMK